MEGEDVERMGLVNNVVRWLEDESTVFVGTFKTKRSRFLPGACRR